MKTKKAENSAFFYLGLSQRVCLSIFTRPGGLSIIFIQVVVQKKHE